MDGQSIGVRVAVGEASATSAVCERVALAPIWFGLQPLGRVRLPRAEGGSVLATWPQRSVRTSGTIGSYGDAAVNSQGLVVGTTRSSRHRTGDVEALSRG